jgi:hypothetical protein
MPDPLCLYVIQTSTLDRRDWHVLAHASSPEAAWSDPRVIASERPVRLMVVRWSEP